MAQSIWCLYHNKPLFASHVDSVHPRLVRQKYIKACLEVYSMSYCIPYLAGVCWHRNHWVSNCHLWGFFYSRFPILIVKCKILVLVRANYIFVNPCHCIQTCRFTTLVRSVFHGYKSSNTFHSAVYQQLYQKFGAIFYISSRRHKSKASRHHISVEWILYIWS